MTVQIEDPAYIGMRLDRYLTIVERAGSRSQVVARISGLRVNELPGKLSHKIREGDVIEYTIEPERLPDLIPQEIPLRILYEDDSVVVIDKPQGMVVHPGAGNPDGTLVNAVLFRIAGMEVPGDSVRPGIVHRLDKETSGTIIVAKHTRALEFLSSQFQERQTEKYYLAIVKGRLPHHEGQISGLIGRDPAHRIRFTGKTARGKTAVTNYRVLQKFPGYALVLLKPETGRTHQLRVHMHDLGCPVLGDPLYARKDTDFPDATLMLHAYSLRIRIPSGKWKRFKSPVPERFREVLRVLRQTRMSSTSAR